MIENYNASKAPASGDFVDVKRYIGVASVNVLAINPNNDKLRKFGWSIPEDAEEPKYVTVDSKGEKTARVRFLVQIQDLEEKPIIALDYWIRPKGTKTQSEKYKIIDSYGRVAYGTYDEVSAHKVPQYSNGPANISPDYKPCFPGQEELTMFLMKYLNVTPLQMFNKSSNSWVPTKNPGRLTIDRWEQLCNGNVSELAEYIALQPDNRVKVILGIRTTEDNKSYQTFLNTTYIGNGALPDRLTGEYATANKAIYKWKEAHQNAAAYTTFSSAPVKEWSQDASEVQDNSGSELPMFPQTNDDEFDDGLPFK